MAADDDRKLTTTEQVETDERKVYLSGGRTLTVSPEVTGDVVELRSPSGLLELRVRVTEEGPVLQLEAIRLSLKAAESVSVEAKTFEVKAGEVKLQSDGHLTVTSEQEMKITSTDDIRVVGKIIHLN